MAAATLEQLATTEAELERIVGSIDGTIEEKTNHLRSQGIFLRYAEVFSSYLCLAETPSPNLEALKRAVFLGWYEVAEPSFCSGVADLPDNARARVVALLESLVPQLDDECRWMLPYYFYMDDFAFPNLDANPNLNAFLSSGDPDGWRSHQHNTTAMRHRGLMGDYWLSIFGSHAA